MNNRQHVLAQVAPQGLGAFLLPGGFAIHDAPEPWGLWTPAFHTDAWDVGPGESSSLPAKWTSADGHTVHLVFSGEDPFSVRKGTVMLREKPKPSFP